MNSPLRWFSRVLWVGFAARLLFAVPAFLAPDTLATFYGLDRIEFSYVWLGNAAMLGVGLALFYAAAAHDPERHPVLAWLIAAGQLLGAAYWAAVLHDAEFGPDVVWFLLFDGAFGVASAVLLQLGLPPDARLGRRGLARLGAALRAPRELNGSLRWFRRVLWLGLAVNAAFVIPALFAPQLLVRSLGAQYVEFSRFWIGATGVALLGVSLAYLVPAVHPSYRPGVSWLAVASRFVAVFFWVRVVSLPERRPFVAYLIADLVIGILLLFLLQRGLPQDERVGAASARRFGRALGGALVLRGRPPALRALWAVGVVVLALIGTVGWYHLVRQVPDEQFASQEEEYKHGAIGLSPVSRIPYWVWKVMPQVCARTFPPGDGWAAFGMLFEPGNELPVGFARREIGYPSIEPNCALCHTASYRATAGGPAHVVPGAPAHALDLEAFQRFLYACATDPDFTPSNVVAAIRKLRPMGPVEASVYRWVIVPGMKAGLVRQGNDYAWQRSRPLQGRGRTDTFNPTKINVFHLRDDGTVGTTDLPAVWNQRPRERLWLHWDGNNNSIRERNFAAAMAIGATPSSVIAESFRRVTDYLLDLPAPRYPFPVDAARATRGKVIYDRECASCHAFGGPGIGQATPVEEVGTDPHRLQSFTAELVQRFHDIDMPPFKFDAYRKTDGYANVPLDGIWARGPFLHNGSVPTLHDLLRPPEQRPRLFHRGYDLFDPTDVGFVSTGPDAEKVGTRYDTTEPGNGNGGHRYGTQHPEAERLDLLEYLKTL